MTHRQLSDRNTTRTTFRVSSVPTFRKGRSCSTAQEDDEVHQQYLQISQWEKHKLKQQFESVFQSVDNDNVQDFFEKMQKSECYNKETYYKKLIKGPSLRMQVLNQQPKLSPADAHAPDRHRISSYMTRNTEYSEDPQQNTRQHEPTTKYNGPEIQRREQKFIYLFGQFKRQIQNLQKEQTKYRLLYKTQLNKMTVEKQLQQHYRSVLISERQQFTQQHYPKEEEYRLNFEERVNNKYGQIAHKQNYQFSQQDALNTARRQKIEDTMQSSDQEILYLQQKKQYIRDQLTKTYLLILHNLNNESFSRLYSLVSLSRQINKFQLRIDLADFVKEQGVLPFISKYLSLQDQLQNKQIKTKVDPQQGEHNALFRQIQSITSHVQVQGGKQSINLNLEQQLKSVYQKSSSELQQAKLLQEQEELEKGLVDQQMAMLHNQQQDRWLQFYLFFRRVLGYVRAQAIIEIYLPAQALHFKKIVENYDQAQREHIKYLQENLKQDLFKTWHQP